MISIYPNPSNGFVRIDYQGDYNLKILNLLGEVVFDMRYNNADESNSIDLSKLTNGIYLLNIITADDAITTRIEIQK